MTHDTSVFHKWYFIGRGPRGNWPRPRLFPTLRLRDNVANSHGPCGHTVDYALTICSKGLSMNNVYTLLLAPRPAGEARATSIPGSMQGASNKASGPAGLQRSASLILSQALT